MFFSLPTEVLNQTEGGGGENPESVSASGRLEGVGGRVVEAGVGEDGQSSHGGEDHEDPEEHPVHHHGHVLPVLLQLDTGKPNQRDKKKKINLMFELLV